MIHRKRWETGIQIASFAKDPPASRLCCSPLLNCSVARAESVTAELPSTRGWNRRAGMPVSNVERKQVMETIAQPPVGIPPGHRGGEETSASQARREHLAASPCCSAGPEAGETSQHWPTSADHGRGIRTAPLHFTSFSSAQNHRKGEAFPSHRRRPTNVPL
jgi:hypothetical protein